MRQTPRFSPPAPTGGIGIHANAYMHTALVLKGVPTVFLMYEGESHVVNRNSANQRGLVERITE